MPPGARWRACNSAHRAAHLLLCGRSAPLGRERVTAAIHDAFMAANKSLGEEMEAAQGVGATAVVGLVLGGKLYVANAGDARAVLSRGMGAERLSLDHKPGVPSEKARIEALGGAVWKRGGADRVDGFLAVSRAFGDLCLSPKVCSLRWSILRLWCLAVVLFAATLKAIALRRSLRSHTSLAQIFR